MDDSDAFERQVAGEMMRRAGPTLRVDDAAIWTAINAPKRSFEAVFGAVRLVVAGVIVAAFGGLLLTVVLTQPPAQDTAPAVGSTASSPPPSTILSPPTADAAPSPTTAASPTPIDPAPPGVTTTQFVRPFEYSIPNGMSPSATYEDTEVFALLVGDEYGREVSPRLFGQVQVNAKENGELGARGILIADVTDADVSTCSLENPRRAYGVVGHGPAAFLDSLQETGGLRLEGQAATTFGGRPAIAASTVWSRCAHTEIIIGTRPIWEAYARLEIPSRIIVAEVGDSTVMAQIWAGTPIDLEEWLPKAQEFIDSMKFLEGGEVAPASHPQSSPPS